MKNIFFFLFIVVFITSLARAYAEDGELIFQKKCNKCHSLDRALTKSKDLRSWKKTTLRMSKYSGGAITEEEAEEVAEYLAGREQMNKSGTPKEDGVETKTSSEKQGGHEIFNFKKVRLEQFIRPEVCSGCHSEIFNQC